MSLRPPCLLALLAAATLLHAAPALADPDVTQSAPDVTPIASSVLKAAGSAVKRVGRGSASFSVSAPGGTTVSVRVAGSVKYHTVTLARAHGRAGGEALKLTLRPVGATGRRVLGTHRPLRVHLFATVKGASGQTVRKDKYILLRR